MNQWDKLFQEKLKEVMHHQHRDYEYASLSPTASGNVARALIAEEYYAQADRIAELEKLVSEMKYEKSSGVYEMNNEPVAWAYILDGDFWDAIHPDEHAQEEGSYTIPLYTHPAKTLKDREADRKRFSDEGFNRWLDESISDSGHTVYDLVENVCEAWHGWENSQYYKPAKTLTDGEIVKIFQTADFWYYSDLVHENDAIEFAKAILRKAQEK